VPRITIERGQAMGAQEGRKQTQNGTLIRGADGGLYFIPDDKFSAYRLSDKLSENARRLLDDVSSEKSELLTLYGDLVFVPEGVECCLVNLEKLRKLLNH
jgi:hypothetical protein